MTKFLIPIILTSACNAVHNRPAAVIPEPTDDGDDLALLCVDPRVNPLTCPGGLEVTSDDCPQNFVRCEEW